MANAGGQNPFDIFGEYILQADPRAASAAMEKIGAVVTRATQDFVNASGRAQERGARRSTQRVQDIYEAGARDLAREQIRIANVTAARIGRMEEANQRRRFERQRIAQEGRNARLTQDQAAAQRLRENHAKQHEQRLTNTQKANAEERLRDSKAADAAQARREKRAADTSLQVKKQADKLEAQADSHAKRLLEQKDRQHRQILVKTWASFLSNLRTTNETAQRAIVHAWQSHWRRRHQDRAHGQSLELNEAKSHFARLNSETKSSYAQQNAIVSRAMIRQQGAIATSQARIQHGVIGGFLNIRNVLLGAGGFITAREVFGNLQDYEQTQVAFTNLLGSAERADDLLKDLFAFNQRTPFNLAGVQDAAKRLLAMGETVQEVIPDLQAIGDVGAKFSASTEDVQGVLRALGQMSQKARVSAQDINQIQERFVGFNARAAIARGLGISVAEAMEQIADGSITGTEGMNAMIEGMKSEENAAGAMEEQMKTLRGAISNFGDLMLSIQVRVLGPFIDDMAHGVKVITSFVDSLFFGSGVFAIIRSGLLGVAAALSLVLAKDVLGQIKIGLLALGAHPVILGLTLLGAAVSILVRDFPELLDPFREFAGMVQSFAVEKLDPIVHFVENLAFAFQSVANLLKTGLQELFSGNFGAAFERFGMAWDRIFKIALEPVIDTVREIFVGAFNTAREWIVSGGVDELVSGFLEAMGRVVSQVRTRVGDILRSDLLLPILGGLAPFLIHSIFGIGFGPIILAGIAAAFLAISPQTRETIITFFTNVWGNVSDWFSDTLPGLFIGGMHALGEFLGGPVVAAILSEGALKAMGAVLGTIAVGAGAFFLGLIDGLRQSIPQGAENLSAILGELITQAFGNLQDSFGALSEILTPIEVLLRGIGGSLEVITDIMGAVPAPIYLAVAAFTALYIIWGKLSKAIAKNKAFQGITTFFGGLPQKIQSAGMVLDTFGQSFTKFQTAGKVVSGLGSGIAAVGRALPGIATAAIIALPIITGLMATAKQRAEAWKQEVKELEEAMFGAGNSMQEFLTGAAVDKVDGLTEALNEVGLSAQDLAVIATGSAQAIGELFVSVSPQLQASLDELGLSVSDFGAAMLEGDEAARDLARGVTQDAGKYDRFRVAMESIPEPLRDVVDQANDASIAFIAQSAAAGSLSRAQMDLFNAISAGDAPAGAAIDLANELTDAQTEQARAFEVTHERVADLIDQSVNAADATTSFRESIDELTGSAIEVGRARQSVEGTFDAIAEGIRQGQGLNELGDQFLTAADGIIGVFETLTEAGRPAEARQEYNRLRGELIESYTQLGLNATQAEAFADALVPNVGEIRRQMIEARQVINRQLRLERGNLRAQLRSGRNFSPETRQAIEDAIADINVELLAHGGIEVPIDAVTPGDDHWAEVVRVMERDAARHPVTIPVRPGDFTTSGGRDLGQQNFFGPGSGGGGGGITGPELPLDNITAWSEDVFVIVNNVRASFEDMKTDVLATVRETGQRLERSFGRTMNNMAEIGRKGATRTVNGITDILRQGAIKVAEIVDGYARALANSLNPLLAAIGEPKISAAAAGASILTFAQGGYSPEMATGSAGPKVHVFNEASSHGEAYIPFDPKHRGRAKDIARKSVRRLGGDVSWFAEGGITAPVANVTGDWQGLHPEFARRLSVWATALGDVFNVNSGFRTHAEQVAAWNRYQAGTGAPAAVPGTSLHEFGLAADGPHWRGRNPASQRLVYPMSYEPWHVQPVEGRSLTGGGIMMPQIPRPPDAGAHGVLSRLAAGMMQWVYDKIFSFASSQSISAPTLGGPAAPGDAAAWMREAMRITGVPSSWFGPLIARMMQESGGNPRAINLTDSNAAAGHPSMGLMQMIMSTFLAHALPGHGDIWNPIDNAISVIRYILDRYGSVFNLPSGGYANGGIIDRPTWALMGEAGPEIVLPLSRPNRLESLLQEAGLSRPRSKGSQPVKIDLNLKVEGNVDPVLHAELASAVRSGVADGMSRAEAIRERW